MSFLDFEKTLNQELNTDDESTEPAGRTGKAGGEATRKDLIEEETIADANESGDKSSTPIQLS